MNQLEKELLQIKEKVHEMWDLVTFQVNGGKVALVNADKELARKIMKRGKKVNIYDIKIDRMCENLFALFNPVAVDLRWILAILKINANLERIGDTAEGIARLVKEADNPFEAELLQTTQVLEMYDAAEAMLVDARQALAEEDTELAKALIKRDKILDKINSKADKALVSYIQAHPEDIAQALKIANIIRKLERIGDQITNIAEEVVFYVDAKVVKHRQKNKRDKNRSKDKDNDTSEE
ncbi:phosphate transport system regulatory protein PhoU [Adhaeribacter aerolatus]|uniref:Phosphate-specific transport system accessory protein PhoU n=1 Tax=Adhaeribacter aerolatus TaxID=670289 RepID=A0A512B1Q2_9BACT|nr:phosphate signaling complex protein PhoU [Adhaeribacter aerolatus]GEO05891.1 phosphate transport system regulatory protein PhoU [Adhaeribacter aerolatus]